MRIHNKAHKVSKKLVTGDKGKKQPNLKITECNFKINGTEEQDTEKSSDVMTAIVGHGKNTPSDLKNIDSIMKEIQENKLSDIQKKHKSGSFLEKIDQFVK